MSAFFIPLISETFNMAIGLKNSVIPDFFLPTEMFIRQDIITEIGNIIKNYGSRAVLITSAQDLAQFFSTVESISKSINNANIGFIIYDEIFDSPNTEIADSAAYFIKKSHCDIILGFGGIDSINIAKAVSILVNNYIFCDNLFENPETNPPIPLVTIPAYPLYGFEVLPMFYLEEIREMEKKVYANRSLFPRATIIDPQISTITGDEITAYSNICSLALATESVISKNANGMVNAYALKSIDLIFKNLPIAYREPNNISARLQLSHASVMCGIAFSVSWLSITLAIALAISSRSNIPVNNAMGVILPHIMEYNLTSSPGKYVQMSKVMDENVRDITVIEAAIKAVEGVRKLEFDINIPQRLSQFSINKNEFSKIAEIAINYPFIENAPRSLTRDEIETILIAAF
jgi:alcohol dehydrogenase